MREYLTSLGYTILRWAEPAEDHLEFEVITPAGARVVTDREWLLLPPAPYPDISLAA